MSGETEREDIGREGLSKAATTGEPSTGSGRELRGMSVQEASNGFVLSIYGNYPGPQNSTIANNLDEVIDFIRRHFS